MVLRMDAVLRIDNLLSRPEVSGTLRSPVGAESTMVFEPDSEILLDVVRLDRGMWCYVPHRDTDVPRERVDERRREMCWVRDTFSGAKFHAAVELHVVGRR